MKAILMSIRPQWVAKILNGEKTIEIRKRFPSDYVGWVYIYCTKQLPYLVYERHIDEYLVCETLKEADEFGNVVSPTNSLHAVQKNGILTNGKVIARFWCDKVGKVHCNSYGLETSEHWYRTTDKNEKELLNECALTFEELDDYLCFGNGYAIYITKLKIFDKPKEISKFMKTLDNFNGLDCFRCSKHRNCSFNRDKKCEKLKLTSAPQSWCYVEI